MARTRTIKPGFFKNEHLAELPYEGRLLFAGLWCLGDRDGRLEDRPKRIKAELFPYDERVNVDGLLSKLQDKSFIVRYIRDGERYIQVLNFKKHQSPNMKEQESTIPPPGVDVPTPEVTEQAPDEHGESTIQAPCDNHTDTALLPYTSLPVVLKPSSAPIDGFFEARYAKHPKKGHKMPAMRAISHVPGIDTPEGQAAFAEMHDRHIASEAWRWKSGARAPFLDEWIIDEGYKYPPAEEASPVQDVMARYAERDRLEGLA